MFGVLHVFQWDTVNVQNSVVGSILVFVRTVVGKQAVQPPHPSPPPPTPQSAAVSLDESDNCRDHLVYLTRNFSDDCDGCRHSRYVVTKMNDKLTLCQ